MAIEATLSRLVEVARVAAVIRSTAFEIASSTTRIGVTHAVTHSESSDSLFSGVSSDSVSTPGSVFPYRSRVGTALGVAHPECAR